MLADADQRARTLWLRFADRSSTSTRATGNSCAGWQSIAPKKRLNWKVRCVGCGYFAACVPSCCVWFDNCRRGQWYPHKCARQVWAVSANLADKCVRSSWAVIKECMHATVHSYTRDQTRVAVNACTTDAAARGHTFFVQQRQRSKYFCLHTPSQPHIFKAFLGGFDIFLHHLYFGGMHTAKFHTHSKQTYIIIREYSV